MHNAPGAPQRCTFILSVPIVLTALATPAIAQQGRATPSTGWIVEVHVGTTPDRVPDNVLTQQLPAQGPTFPTGGGAASRQVPSWYFGDGAAIVNGAADRLKFPHIVSLDPVLTGAATTTTTGANVGVRIGHTITKRVLVLFSYDQAAAQLPLTSSAEANVTASNASFQPFWNNFLVSRGLTLTNISTNSTLAVDQASGSEKMLAVTADIRVVTLGGWTPFVTVGGGVALPLPQVQTEVTLLGNYQAVVAPGRPSTGAVLNETDQVRIRYEMVPAPFTVVGVGVERGVSAHVGVRAEFRSLLGVNQVRTRIDTRPISGPTPFPFVIRAGGTPDVQVSTNPAVPTTLSLQGVDHVDSFEAKGNQATFSAGLFLRF